MNEKRRKDQVIKCMRKLYCLGALEKLDNEIWDLGYISERMKQQDWRFVWTIPAFRGEYINEPKDNDFIFR
jgi:hypothetical protein